jgi:hypothetical protein
MESVKVVTGFNYRNGANAQAISLVAILEADSSNAVQQMPNSFFKPNTAVL